MIDNNNLASLSFFTVTNYHYLNTDVFDSLDTPRPHYCMGFIVDGEGQFEFEEKSITVKKGEIIFVPAGSQYRSTWTGSPDITYISMHFFFLSHIPFPGNRHYEIQKISPSFEGEFEPFFKNALSIDSSDTSDLFSALSYFYGIMGLISPRLVYSKKKKFDERIEQAILYLEEHYTQNTSIDTLAEIAHMSVSHCYACFKASTGMTPVEYRNRLRIRYATMYLMQSSLSIEQISDKIGFESAKYFRKVFQNQIGCPPSKYKTKKNTL